MHDLDIFHEHLGMSEEERAEIARTIWSQENVELSTIGIDIGSSTSHLLFAKVLLQRQSQGLSSRFVVVHRQVMWRSPIMLTPFLPDGTIDAARLGAFIADCYAQAGFGRDDVDSGAVILTGEAIKRHNARAIDELFAAEAGKFVCATAGHKLECTLAAHGAGAVRLSQGARCLHPACGYRRRHHQTGADRPGENSWRFRLRGRRTADRGGRDGRLHAGGRFGAACRRCARHCDGCGDASRARTARGDCGAPRGHRGGLHSRAARPMRSGGRCC